MAKLESDTQFSTSGAVLSRDFKASKISMLDFLFNLTKVSIPFKPSPYSMNY